MQKEAMLYQTLEDDRVRCRLCAHYCKIDPQAYGFCGVRRNIDGRLHTLVYGETIARHVDPIEKKPLYHFLPGSRAYSIATPGCNFHCDFCQNWQISQLSGDYTPVNRTPSFPPEAVVGAAQENNCDVIAYTYTEPTIFFEYAYDTARLAQKAGIRNVFVTNGYMSPKAVEAVSPYLDGANVDLKAWSESYYATHCRAHLKPVLDTIRRMKEAGIWLEITTLIIPGENDAPDQLTDLTRFIAGVDENIPWHISRFHPDYRLTDAQATPMETLHQAKAIGEHAGLRFIYIGNAPADNTTYCPECGQPVVERDGMGVKNIRIKDHACGACGTRIPGVWE
ncbi:MAG: AmmeMemoRadiSam system radical SAM enzyme [Deltaproteobacteria bacterium]